MPLRLTLFALLLVALMFSGSARSQVLLLGEVHDNPDGHHARYALLQQRVDAGWHPAIAMEQFDRERQADLDRASRECRDADCVVAMASGAKAGWNWALYKPVIELALREHLPLLAANLSRADAGKVVADGFAAGLDPAIVSAYGLDHALPPDVLQPQVDEVRDGHCNMLPPEMLQPMASAQVARDVVMAELLRAHADGGIVLLAGNGHVRRDIGVPYWLRARGIAAETVGFVEDPAEAAHFDRADVVPAFAREDPCAKFKAPPTPEPAPEPAPPAQ
jgi:uncharacterized iron-regulated protein